jgi:hypothetical protein
MTPIPAIRIAVLGIAVWGALPAAAPMPRARAAAPSHGPSSDLFAEASSIIVCRCLECHQQGKPSGGLVLATMEGLQAGGDSGAVIDPDDPAASYLLDRVRGGEMPPPLRGVPQQLPEQELRVLEEWIAAGADWPEGRILDLYEQTTDVRAGRDFWSLRPVHRPEVPAAAAAGDSQHPVDRFIRAQLTEQDLTPAPTADRRTLIRRVYNDLIGLPPTAAQIAAFEHDTDPHAWERLIDELLASPHFGERWARYWLDLVRFAETSGYERDQPKPFAWKYRDWVVRAVNDDLPYDRFVIMQLAGDELPRRTDDDLIATGFLRLGTWNDEPNDPEDYQYERLEDLVHAASSAFLGMSVKCARCHDHKFDPIPQEDYYRMAAAFWPGPIAARDRELLGGPSADELGAPGVLGWTDITTAPAPLHLLKNGERHHPQQQVAAASLTFWSAGYREFEPPAADARTTRRRLQLAQWIAAPAHPLTARVIVNRLWQHHFGAGLVRSPNNFGFTGDAPTHPELLDWLAAELVESGWSLKHVHRLLLTSQTYRQSSVHPQQDAFSALDFANRHWWRAERRRLDAESLRDAILTASGEIDLRVGGESFRPTISPEALEGLSRKDAAYVASPPAEQHRRSLYIAMQRSLLPPLMTTFDLCDTTLPCGERDVTTVAPQSLALLNNPFIHEQAQALAGRALAQSGDEDERMSFIWQAVLGRLPSADEAAAARGHIARQLARFQSPPTQSAESRATPGTLGGSPLLPPDGLALWLDAAEGVTLDAAGRVERWDDLSPSKQVADQQDSDRRPLLVTDAVGGQPALRFSGQRQFLSLSGSLLTQPNCTIFAVVTDVGPDGHREILSNWSGGDGNIGTSVFLGLTAAGTVRFSDAYPDAGTLIQRDRPFVLSARNGSGGASVHQNLRETASRSQPLGERRLDTPWVIGQQGNIDGEYWHGDIAAVIVYDRELTPLEREHVTRTLMDRFAIQADQAEVPPPPTPETLAWASLCVVLFNSNEFLYVD